MHPRSFFKKYLYRRSVGACTTKKKVCTAADATSVRMAVAALRGGACRTDGFEASVRGVSSEDGDGFAEFLCGRSVCRGGVIVVQRRQIIVDQRNSVDEFDGASGMKRGCDIAGEDAPPSRDRNGGGFAFHGEDAVTIAVWMEEGGADSAGRSRSRAHRRSGGILRRMGEVSLLQNWRAAGCRGASRFSSPARDSNGSAASLPSAFFRRISTRPSPLPVVFWHSA